MIRICGVEWDVDGEDLGDRFELIPDEKWETFDGSIRQYMKSIMENDDNVSWVATVKKNDDLWYTNSPYRMIAIFYKSTQYPDIKFISR